MEKINIAELLKDCPKGMELDCTLFEKPVKYLSVTYVITIKTSSGHIFYLTKDGCLHDTDDAKCVIFPKGKTTWEGFVPPCKFKDGDVLFVKSVYNWIIIYKESENEEKLHKYVAISDHPKSTLVFDNHLSALCYKEEISKIRFATEEEKEKLFQAINDNGYRWNDETKTLDKLFKAKFKVGDRVKSVYNNNQYDIIGLTDTHYTLAEVKNKFKYLEPIIEDKNLELVPKKFDITTLKPFDSRVLVREGKTDVWQPAFYGFFNQHNKRFYTTSTTWLMCIPYNEDTKHLVGTTNDCDDFYKTWE